MRDFTRHSIKFIKVLLYRGFVITTGMMIGVGCEKVVYIELPADESEGPYVTVSVYHFQVTYSDGDPYVSADGKVKNHGPGSIWSVRVLAQSNYGSSRISGVNPSRREVGEIGDWGVTGLQGTYVSDKVAMFDSD